MAKILERVKDRWAGKKVGCLNCKTKFRIEKKDKVAISRRKGQCKGPDPRNEGPLKVDYEVCTIKCPECKKEVVLSEKQI